MKSRKLKVSYILLLCVISIAMSCNIGNQKKNDSKSQYLIKNVGVITIIDTNKFSPRIKKCTLENLLTHFKEQSNFPFIIDSLSMEKVTKRDSLGTSELNLLVKKWFKDALVNDSDYFMQNFYTIDSLKANHLFDQWMEAGTESEHSLGDPTHSNAYSLGKLKLSDGTILLVWVLEASDNADPLFNDINIYFTTLYNNTIGETFKLGNYYNGIDPPAAGQTVTASKLTIDGKLLMEENFRETDNIEDTVSVKWELIHTQYEYSISNGKIALITKKEDAPKQIKTKI